MAFFSSMESWVFNDSQISELYYCGSLSWHHGLVVLEFVGLVRHYDWLYQKVHGTGFKDSLACPHAPQMDGRGRSEHQPPTSDLTSHLLRHVHRRCCQFLQPYLPRVLAIYHIDMCAQKIPIYSWYKTLKLLDQNLIELTTCLPLELCAALVSCSR